MKKIDVMTAEQMDLFYNDPDPWHYKTDPEDQKRKFFTVETLQNVIKWKSIETYDLENREHLPAFSRALDIGCGEGWITAALPALEKFGYEQSPQARARLPWGVKPVMIPDGMYDLIVANGVLYRHYDWRMIMGLIRKHARHIVLTGHIATDEVEEAIQKFPGTQILQLKFPYKELTWKTRVFDVTVRSSQ